MKLYYSPGACSLAVHLMLEEIGVKYEAISVDLRTKRTVDGKDFHAVNPKGYVPALEIDQGQLLTEDGIILQYLADSKPELKFIAKSGSFDRIRQLEMTHFIATEVHKSFGPYFDPTSTDDAKNKAKVKLDKRLGFINQAMDKNTFVMGSQYTLADPYLFTMMTWVKKLGIDVSAFGALQAHYETIRQRPATDAALKAEGLNTKL